jgi:multidrug efflux system outer membrane protein
MMTGCMVGPDYSRPDLPVKSDAGYYNQGPHSQDINDVNSIDDWWQHFGDPVTADLVTQALENNYDIKAAAARVLQAQAAFAEASGRKLPEVSYGLNRRRGKTSFNFGGAGRFSNLNTTYTQDISVSYILDLFGKLKRSERAAWDDLLATKASEQAIINSLIAGVIKARIDIATTQRILAIARADTKNRQRGLEIVERRYKQGLVGPVDVRLARENLAAAKAIEPRIELSLKISNHALDVLLGRQPGSSKNLPETLADLPDLEQVPIGLPASLLDRRPDVVAAELSLESANEQIGVSIAGLYPDLTLTGAVGRSADRWRDIWLHEAETYSAVLALAQPIFKGGQLRARVNAAKGRYEELAADYANVVITAIKEVEDALVSEQLLQVQLEYVQLRFIEASAAENLSRQRYQRGVESILAVLETERRRRIAENELALLKGQIWNQRVNLLLALGGEWAAQQQPEG